MNSTKSMSILITDDRFRVNCSKNKMWLAPAACRCQKNMDRKGERESEIKEFLDSSVKKFSFRLDTRKESRMLTEMDFYANYNAVFKRFDVHKN